ncbi:hypothetical protein [Paenibacillus sp. PL2-23]|uniref:hypothetical protein n=1 Tax=Paenibacillus sp. PL2-23 TaxID=2100729 RepID=UPI0030F7ED2F
MANWHIFCEESGDKGIPWIPGSSHFYIVTSVLVLEQDVNSLVNTIDTYKYKVLRMKAPLEWKKLSSAQKKDDKIISKFLRSIDNHGPNYIVSQVICNKHETNGAGMIDRTKFMNYLYGLMFKRLSVFLKSTNSRAQLFIDRNTDTLAQESLRQYIASVSRYQTGQHPRHSKPKWINPETHSILGLSDFMSGVTLRSLTDYQDNVSTACKVCNKDYGIYSCTTSNFSYYRSFKNVVDSCYYQFPKWDWKGLLYHPYTNKDNYKHIFIPQ